MSSPVAEVLAALAAAFRERGARWYLFGAQAALLHGAARLTADVDVTVDVGPAGAPPLLAALRRGGFVPRVADIHEFAERTRVLPLAHEPTGMPVDVVLAGPGPEMLFLARACARTVEGVTVPVARAEDVVVMKVLAGRPKDLDDVVAILAAHPVDFDLELARATLREFEEALDRRDLSPALEAAFQRARER
jgi:hypothetical protein